MLKKLESKKFLDSFVWGGGDQGWTNSWTLCFKKLVILKGGPVKKNTLYFTLPYNLEQAGDLKKFEIWNIIKKCFLFLSTI